MIAVYLRRACDEARLAVILGFCTLSSNLFAQDKMTQREMEPRWSSFTDKLSVFLGYYTNVVKEGTRYYITPIRSLIDTTQAIEPNEKNRITYVEPGHVYDIEAEEAKRTERRAAAEKAAADRGVPKNSPGRAWRRLSTRKGAGGSHENLDEAASKKYYDEYKKKRNCIANSVPDSIIVPVLQYFIPIFVSKLVEVRKQVEQERKLILGWNITIDRLKEDIETQQSVPDSSSSNRKRVRTDVNDSANERPTIRRKLGEGTFVLLRAVYFSNAASGSSTASVSVSGPSDAYKKIVGALSNERETSLRNYKGFLRDYVRVLRALAILLDTDVLRMAIPGDSQVRKLTNDYAHTNVSVRKRALEQLIETDSSAIYPASLRKGKVVESSLRDYGLDVQALEDSTQRLLETFKMDYDPALGDPFSGKLDSFITEEGKKASALIPKQDRDRALQIWRSDCDRRRPREENETKCGT